MSVYVVIIMLSSVVSHLFAAITTSDPAEREILGNINILTVYLTP